MCGSNPSAKYIREVVQDCQVKRRGHRLNLDVNLKQELCHVCGIFKEQRKITYEFQQSTLILAINCGRQNLSNIITS